MGDALAMLAVFGGLALLLAVCIAVGTLAPY